MGTSILAMDWFPPTFYGGFILISIDVENCYECPYFDEFSAGNKCGCKHPRASRDCLDEYDKKAEKTGHYEGISDKCPEM